jgi:hypothetical protein
VISRAGERAVRIVRRRPPGGRDVPRAGGRVSPPAARLTAALRAWRGSLIALGDVTSMLRPKQRKWLTRILIGVLVLFTPVLVLIATLEVLFLFGEIEFSDISLLEFVELYLLDLTILVLFAFGIYRITAYLVEEKLIDELERIEAEEGESGDGDDPG